MKLEELGDILNKMNDSKSIKDAAILIHQYINLTKILLYQDASVTDSIVIKEICDEFDETIVLKQNAKLILKQYKRQCEKFIRNEEFSYSEKMDQLLFCKSYFQSAKEQHNYSNYFSFTTRDVFFLVTDNNVESPIDFDELKLEEEQLNTIREFFLIRMAFYDALESNISIYLHQMELLRYQYTQFKLNKKNATRLLWEFVLAITQDDRYIKLEDSQKPLFEKAMFDFFGLSYKDRGKALSNIFRKGVGYANELKYLRDKFQSINKEDLVKSPKKN